MQVELGEGRHRHEFRPQEVTRSASLDVGSCSLDRCGAGVEVNGYVVECQDLDSGYTAGEARVCRAASNDTKASIKHTQ